MVAISRSNLSNGVRKLSWKVVAIGILTFGMLLISSFSNKSESYTTLPPEPSQPATKGASKGATLSYKSPLAYGTKSLKEKTAELVETAIREGFRHIVTGGHHQAHNETGVGVGWKASGVDRKDLFLQTSFVPFQNDKDFEKKPGDRKKLPFAIEEQVKYSISSSLEQLQTDYLDALVFHNFRAKRWNENQIRRAWKVMEDYVDMGVIRYLGMTSVHDSKWLDDFYNSTRIKPVIIQNRFHSNRQYDVPMQEVFDRHNIHVQRFWLLNGSSGQGKQNKDMATEKNVTPAQLMLGFTMSMSETCLVGTTSQQHMKDDIEISKCFPSLFPTEEEKLTYARKLGMKQPSDRPLPPSPQTSGPACGSTQS